MGAAHAKIADYYTPEGEEKLQQGFFTLYNATSNETHKPVSIFVHQPGGDCNALKRHKTIRHPGLLKFHKSIVSPNTVCIVTDRVVPLQQVLNELSEDQILVGLYQVLKTLTFLHASKLVHGDIRLDSIYYNDKDKRWQIGNLELLTEVTGVNQDYIDKFKSIVPEEYWCPEDTRGELASNPILRDAYGFGKMLLQVLPKKSQWSDLKSFAEMMTTKNSQDRLGVTDLLEQDFFAHHPLVQIAEQFLKDFRALPVQIKIEKFSGLYAQLQKVSKHALEEIYLPLILNPDLLTEAGSDIFFREFLDTNFETNILLTQQLYTEQILPFLKQQFKSSQYEIRFRLLQLFNTYMDQLILAEPESMEQWLLPELLKGVEEQEPTISYPSIAALCALLPHYSNEYETRKQEESKKPVNQRNLPKHAPTTLCDDYILRHTLRLCITDEPDLDFMWPLIDALVQLWKQLLVQISKQKKQKETSEAAKMSKLLLRAFHLILRTLSPDLRIELMTSHLLKKNDTISESGVMLWIPKLMELVLPFLQDDNRTVRRAVSDFMTKIIALQSAAMDNIPTISRKRDTSGVVERLKQSYQSLQRKNTNFARMGPRSVHLDWTKDKMPFPRRESIEQPVQEVSPESPKKETKDWDQFFDQSAEQPISASMDAFEIDTMIASLSQPPEKEQEEGPKYIDRQDLVAAREHAMRDSLDEKASELPQTKPEIIKQSLPVIPLVDQVDMNFPEEVRDEGHVNPTDGWGDEDFDQDLELDDVKL
ncbi:hypothetical protein EDD86DRAFT_197540 [Gorgonomyces haynaldii]|nr:hypothetical protein EDD86DRAFT_197540 [Gorgonomyces haynaldii]